ncbi:zinc finger protein-like [Tropilaelaps mercedesae]|uniref:Zinc finger protein-like n=1 Tax=Tropilaelaps mercedesae TaxID=418985 RepID=A0A1V9X7E1_9ACAR|nr:zinc finger protein-like [Tropilaelaps mercedesae]
MLDCSSFGTATSPNGHQQPQQNSFRLSAGGLLGNSGGGNGSGGGGSKSYNQTTMPVKRTHFGVKNYECSVCGVMTTRSDNLRQHMLAKHGFVAPHISHSGSGAPDIILPSATAQLFNNNNNTK